MFDHNSEKLLDIAVHAMVAEQLETAERILETVVNTGSSAMSVSWAYYCLSTLGRSDGMQHWANLREAAAEEEEIIFPGFNRTSLRLYHQEFPEITQLVATGIGYERVRAEFQERLQREPNNLNLAIALAYCLCRSQREEDGIDTLGQVIRADRLNYRALGIRGDRFRRSQRLELAEQDLGRAIYISPESATINLQLGLLQVRMEQYVPAIESLSKSIALAPDFAEPHTERANLWNKVSLPSLEIYDHHCVHRIRTEMAGYQVPDSHWPQACQEVESYIAGIVSESA